MNHLHERILTVEYIIRKPAGLCLQKYQGFNFASITCLPELQISV